MKQWKEEIITALNKRAEELKEIHFQTVTNECGFKHIKTQEVQEIANVFLKQNPTYKAYRFISIPGKNESLFTTLVLSECEYETEEEFLHLSA